MDVSKLKNLVDNIVNDPESANNLSGEEISQLKKYLNPLGAPPATSPSKYAVMSVISQKEKYAKRLITTAVVGYVYRAAAEYLPRGVLDESGVADKTELKKNRASLKEMLDRIFVYDPDLHVRSSKNSLESVADLIEKKASEPKNVASEPPANAREDFSLQRKDILASYQSVADAHNAMSNAISMLSRGDSLNKEDLVSILMKKMAGLDEAKSKLGKIARPITEVETLGATTDLPADFFGGFDSYFEENYEKLRQVTERVYCIAPDIEYSVIFYDSFDDEKKAREYYAAHEAEFRYGADIVENKGITLLGPWKENCDRVEFLNRNTEILKNMMDQSEADKKLGKDLMEKRVKAKKTEQIKNMGPDDPRLASYVQAVATVQNLGAKPQLSAEDQNKIHQAHLAQMAATVPDNAVQSLVHYPATSETGEEILRSARFFTQEEDLLHMQPGSEFSAKYQDKK